MLQEPVLLPHIFLDFTDTSALCSSILSLLFPLYASHRALTSQPPSPLTPWLTYYIVLSAFLLIENHLSYLLALIPFYAYLRLFLFLYLLLPQTQGANHVYQTYISPFLIQHEAQIERNISDAHDRMKSASVAHLHQAIDFVREQIFGLAPKQQPSAPPPRAWGESYATSLLARFNLPSASIGGTASRSPSSSVVAAAAAPTTDFYTLLTATVDSALALSNVPAIATVAGDSPEDKISFIATQRERLGILMGFLDREEASALSATSAIPTPSPTVVEPVRHVQVEANEVRLRNSGHGEGLKKVRSDLDFERVEREDAPRPGKQGRTSSAGWVAWAWSGSRSGSGNGSGDGDVSGKQADEQGVAVSSAVDKVGVSEDSSS